MSDEHILRMTEQIGELNGTVRGLTETVEKFVERSETMHRDHYNAEGKNKAGIEKINSRHAAYWKVIGSVGGISGIVTLFSKWNGH